MATKLEKSQVDIIRTAREENDDFNLAVQLDMLYCNIEESSFRLLLDQIGLGYRKGRYLGISRTYRFLFCRSLIILNFFFRPNSSCLIKSMAYTLSPTAS